MFPRDAASVTLIQDGRWQLPPHPVQWTILPRFQRPVAVRREKDGDTTVLLMAREEDCFAISMPYQTETHFSAYLSLFGRDLSAGRPSVARARLQVLESPGERELIDCHGAFQREMAGD